MFLKVPRQMRCVAAYIFGVFSQAAMGLAVVRCDHGAS
ncbi:unnamed protein product [Acidithrix sp. C25]|nr:unnamed protein product [Acidithrix sp. C25]